MTQTGGILNKQLFLLDTKSYTWVTKFQANSSPTSTNTNNPPSTSTNTNNSSSTSTNINVGMISGLIIAGVTLIIIIILVIILVKRFMLSKKEKNSNADNNVIISIHENDNNDRYSKERNGKYGKCPTCNRYKY